MATNTHTEPSAWGLGRTLSSLSTFVNGGPLHVKHLVEGPTNLFQIASRGFQSLVSGLGGTYTTPGSSSPQETYAPISSSETIQTVTGTAQTPKSTNSNKPPTSGAGDPEAASQVTAAGENGLFKTIRTCRKVTMWATFLIVGIVSLALIVVPGLVLGLVTGQLPWGIALSGTIVTVCGFFAGPVYTIVSAVETDESGGEDTGEEMV